MNFFPQAAVIAFIVLVGASFLFFTRSNEIYSVSLGSFGKRKKAKASAGFRVDDAPDSGMTIMPPVLYVEQLDPETMRIVERFEISDIPAMGVSISRPNAHRGSIKLNPSVKAAYSVSENHVRIGMDTQGLFIQDQKNDGRMRLAKGKVVVGETDITDGLILYVGIQPLRFVIPDLWRDCGSDMTIFFDTVNAEASVRNTRHFGRRGQSR